MAKEQFSNSHNSHIQKWGCYISGTVNRQDYLETALKWVSRDNIDHYMMNHRRDNNINELVTHFNSVIDWVSNVFVDTVNEMKSIDWGLLYDKYHNQAYNPVTVSKSLQELYSDPYIKCRKGIFEYILGGMVDSKLLEVRVFDDAVKKKVYNDQTQDAIKKEISNCPLCSLGHEINKRKIWTLSAMDADNVAAWSKGGATSISNFPMLCKTHNRSKGNN